MQPSVDGVHAPDKEESTRRQIRKSRFNQCGDTDAKKVKPTNKVTDGKDAADTFKAVKIDKHKAKILKIKSLKKKQKLKSMVTVIKTI